MLKTEFRRAFSSKLLWWTCGITFVMLAVSGWDYIVYRIENSLLTAWWQIYIISLPFGMLSVFYPIVVMIPYALSYRGERDSGCRQLILLKTSRRAYLGSKILAVSGSAFTAMFLPAFVWIPVCRFVLGVTNPAYDRLKASAVHFALPLYDNHPVLYAVMYALHISVLGAVFAILGLGLSAVIKNRYAAILSPFCYCFFSSSILSSGINHSLAALDLLPLQPYYYTDARPLGYWTIPIYEIVLLVVGLALFIGGDYYAGKA